MGFDVDGLDLSKKNIAFASQFENEKLKFFVHDMREVFKPNTYDYVFNLFTSFGYLSTKEENLGVIDAVKTNLKDGGKFLLDFLNPYVVINNLVNCEEKEIGGVKFTISREYTAHEFILKKIGIEDNGETFDFMEKVKAIRRTEFLEYFERAGMKVLDVFGDYHLNEYVSDTSERLILLVQK
jgi:SAM-dependent methyltransferase